ncbi:MAG: hypothetical protein R3C20_16125 [Planctomycetaceae bacterium]
MAGGIGLVVAGVVVVFLYREIRLSAVPRIRMPFADMQAVDRILPTDNAFREYDAASLTAEPKGVLAPRDDWNSVPEAWRIWLEENRFALLLIEAGAGRPSAMVCLPHEQTYTSMLSVAHHRSLHNLTLLEASRCRAIGRHTEAWRWLRIAFRHSRHCGMHAMHLNRLIGAAFHSQAVQAIMIWSESADVDSEFLQRAWLDIRKDFAMTLRPSETLCNQYYFERNTFEFRLRSSGVEFFRPERNPQNPVKAWLDCEPERGLRLIDLVYANWRQQIDLPRRVQSLLPGSQFGLFVNSADKDNPVDAETLERWCLSSSVARNFLRYNSAFPKSLRTEKTLQGLLEVSFAARIYFHRNRRFPASPGDLEHLLPDGWPEDATSDSPEGLSYRCENDGLSAVIWCAGYDGDNDGGNIDTQPNDESYDLGFRLKALNARGK